MLLTDCLKIIKILLCYFQKKKLQCGFQPSKLDRTSLEKAVYSLNWCLIKICSYVYL